MLSFRMKFNRDKGKKVHLKKGSYTGIGRPGEDLVP